MLNSLQKQLDEIPCPYTKRHLHIRLLLGEVVEIADGLPQADAAGNIDVDVQIEVRAELGGKGQRQGERIIDGATLDTLILVMEFHVETRRLGDELSDRRFYL